jgi:hypothetical protein
MSPNILPPSERISYLLNIIYTKRVFAIPEELDLAFQIID